VSTGWTESVVTMSALFETLTALSISSVPRLNPSRKKAARRPYFFRMAVSAPYISDEDHRRTLMRRISREILAEGFVCPGRLTAGRGFELIGDGVVVAAQYGVGGVRGLG